MQAKTVRIIAEVKNPPLKCVLARGQRAGTWGVKLTVVPLSGKGHATSNCWLYAFTTVNPLQPGYYRLSVWGRGQMVYLGVAEL